MKCFNKIVVILILGFISLTLNTSAQVNADFSVSQTEGCSPLVIRFQDQSTGNPTQWQWNFGNGNNSNQQNPSAIYTSPGQYTVTLIASNNSSTDTETKTALITVFRDPNALFTLTDSVGCIPKVIEFTDLSTEGDAPIVQWDWDFGDGNLSNDQNPTHTFTNPGNYNVVLGVRDANGCRSQHDIGGIEILPVPTANFNAGPTHACSAPLNVQFNNTSSASGSVNYLWDFGDGNTSTQVNPNHTYNSTGDFTVSLIVTDQSGCSDTLTRNDLIQIDDLQSSFVQSETVICQGESVQFTSTSGPDARFHSWDFGDGNSGSGNFAANTYNTPGLYDVELTVTNGNGCTETVVINDAVEVEPTPTISFTADNTNGCEVPFTVNFTNNSTNANSYTWDFGDGNTSTQANPTHTYTSEGDYHVTLTATNSAGCSNTVTYYNYIEIDIPNAWFRADERRGCIDLTVNFEDRSSADEPIVSWDWDFGDGNTSTQENPTHIYTVEGIYDVTLTITTASGCTHTRVRRNYIRAGTPPNVDFSGTPTQACMEEPINFQDLSDVGDEWLWQFGDGGFSTDQNPSHIYGDTGVFTVSLVVWNNGCPDTLIRPDYIRIFPPDARFDIDHNCIDPYTVNFTDQSLAPDTWWWDFGDGTTSTNRNPSHTYASRGNYTVTLAVADTVGGCVDTLEQNVQVTDPIADFYADDSSGCARFGTQFHSSSTDGNSYYWLAENGDEGFWSHPTLFFDDPGIYDVTLVVTDIHGCQDSITKPDFITVYGIEAEFEADSLQGCAPLLVNYQDSSVSYMGNIISHYWEFGNGDTSTLQNPTQTYSNPGSYTISLTVTDDNGCVDTESKTNYVQPTFPTVDFTADTLICLENAANFQNQSTGTGLQFEWTFGDGDSSTAQNPSHQYADTGLYTIGLYAEDINGCNAYLQKNQYVKVIDPRADFEIDTNYASCPPLLVRFTDESRDSIVSWLWDFGDGQTSDLRNPGHTYIHAGVYYVSLTVTNHLGCTDTYQYPDSIVVEGPQGTFDFNQFTECIPSPVEFFSNADSNLIHIWDFGNGHVEVGNETITYPYDEVGVFHPTLILDNGRGCVISVPHPDSIRTRDITADFTESQTKICGSATVNFTDLSTANPSGIVAWYWDFGNGNTSTQQNPSVTYTTPGQYDVSLIVENSYGCTDTLLKTQHITVDFAPTANFTPSDTLACAPVQLTFQDNSTSGSTIAIWEWDFGNGNTSSLQNPSETFTQAGTFTIELKVENSAGCRDSIQRDIVLNESPSVNSSNDTSVCEGSPVQLQTSGGISYQWLNISNLSCSTCPNPSLLANNSETYIVEVTNIHGCTTNDTIEVNAMPYPNLAINNDTVVCNGATVQLNANGADVYSWNANSNLSCTNCANPLWSGNGNDILYLEAASNFGCTVFDTMAIQTREVQADFSPSDTIACAPENIQFQDLSNSNDVITSWNWDFGTGDQSTAQNPDYTYQNDGLFTVQLQIETSLGCTDTATQQIRIHPLPVANAGPDSTICIGASLSLNASGGVTYAWTPAQFLSDSSSHNPSLAPTQDMTYQLLVTDQNGCQNTDEVSVFVNPLPIVNTSPDTSICLQDSIQLFASGGATYNWTPGNALSNVNISNPIAFPQVDTDFEVLVTDSNGCQNTGEIQLTVNPLPQNTISPDDAVCFGDQMQIEAGGGVAYQWFPISAVDCDTCAATQTNIQSSQQFNVQITNVYGCQVEDSVFVTVNPLPQLAVSPDTGICFGASTQLTANGATVYQWTSQDNSLSCNNCQNPVASPADDMQYYLFAENQYGCAATDSVFVDVYQYEADIMIPDSMVCFPDSIQYFDASYAENGIAQWQWNFGDGNFSNQENTTYTHGTPGIYNIELSFISNKNCKDTTTQNVYVHALPEITATPDTSVCQGDSVQLNATGGQTYFWMPINISGQGTANPKVVANVNQNYLVFATDSNGCKGRDTASIRVLAKPVAEISPDTFICKGNTVPLFSDGGFRSSWAPASGLVDTSIRNPLVNPDTSTLYNVRVYAENGCYDDNEVAVNIYPPTKMKILGDSMICGPGQLDLRAFGGKNHRWSLAEDFTCDSCTYTTYNATESSTIYVNGVNSNGCPVADSMNIVVLPQPILELEPSIGICAGESTQLNAEVNSSVDFDWTPTEFMDDSNSLTPTVTPTNTTSFILTVENNYGCSATDTSTVFVIQKVETDYVADTAVCIGNPVHLKTAVEYNHLLRDVEFSWYPQNAFTDPSQPEQIFTPENSGDYIVVSNSGRCAPDTQKVSVMVHQLPTIDAGEDRTAYYEEEIELDAYVSSTVDSVHWSPAENADCADCQSTYFTVLESGNVEVFVRDIYGCEGRDDFDIRMIETCEDEVFIPNTFTPNKDEANDIFRVRYRSEIELDYLRIFDRWGKLVFEGEDIDQGWNGRLPNGTEAKLDVYAYYFSAECPNGTFIMRKGNVTLLR